jgi:PAS domain S-box-containing protein
MSDIQSIVYLTNTLRSFLNGQYIPNVDSSVRDSSESPEMKELLDLFESSFSRYGSGIQAIKSISDGDLSYEITPDDPILDPIKKLQSKLKHLIWQTQMIAAGDYEQTIDFIGDFSISFNQLINSLKLRQELEQKLVESQRKFQLITENTIDVIWIMDVATQNFTYISPSVYNLRGLTIEEAMKETFEQSMTPESALKANQKFELLLTKIKNNEPMPDSYDEYQQWCKNGQVIDIEVSATLIYNQNGEPKEILGVSRDITKRKKAELALKESEEKYRLISDNSNDVIWTIDIASGKITFLSPSVTNVSGFPAVEVIDKGFRLFLLPEFIEKEEQYYSLLLSKIKNGEPLPNGNGRYQLRRKDGRIVDVETYMSIIHDDEEYPKEILGITRDITDRISTEKALKESEEKYRLITENAQDVIWKIDIKTLHYNYISPSIKKLTGHCPEELLGRPLSEILVPDSYQKSMQLISERLKHPLEEGLNICERFQLYTKDGGTVDAEATISYIQDENGKAIEILGVSRDITERIAIENNLMESEAKLTRLLALQSSKNKQLINQLQYIFSNAINAIAFFSIDGETIKFSSCNKRWADGIGFDPQELEDYDIDLMTDRETSLLYRKFIQRAIEMKQPIEEFHYWHNLHLHTIIIPIVDEQTGEITSCGSLVYNISEKIEAKSKIRETEERFFSIFNNSKDAIVLLTLQLEIVDVNESFYQLHGAIDYPKQNILKSYFPVEYHKMVLGLIKNIKEGISIPTFETDVYRYNGTLVSVEISTSVITYKQTPMLLCIIRDISPRKEMERMMTKVGTQIETRERRNLAADLHDNVGPLLSSMNMYLSVLSRKDELQPYTEVMDDIRRILKDTISSVREISNNLSPQVLENFGLTAALDQFFETKKRLINIHVQNTIGNIRFSEIKETMIYNVIIEAFNNTLKHSEANLVQLTIHLENNSVHVLYSDNGIGFNLEEKTKIVNNNLGIFSIINRVKILDGNYTIETSSGNGFVLKVDFPFNNQ